MDPTKVENEDEDGNKDVVRGGSDINRDNNANNDYYSE
jgi:hypothetical protein